MSKLLRRSLAVQEALRRLGNPYASLQIFDEEDIGSEFRPLTDAERSYVRALGNQYAPLSIALCEDTQEPVNAIPGRKFRPGRLGRSKVEFTGECRRILRQYVPSTEKGRLRPHHREFIARNQNRSALKREYLLFELRKYDLADIRGFQVRFNREREELTADKLKQIELKVIGEEK